MLLERLSLGGITLSSRVVMAPMTRCSALENQVPTEEMAAYYAARASAGLIIAEATSITACANAYVKAPGIYHDEQVYGWREVTDAVHAKGGKIFLQLWHAGMMGHSSFREGDLPLSPSGVRPIREKVPRSELTYEKPRLMVDEDFSTVIGQFVSAAKRAKTAGFDGVELHGAGGYLLDSFLHHHTNRRDDHYGREKERFLLEVADAVLPILPMGVRISPAPLAGMENMLGDPRDREVFIALLQEFNARKLAYVHVAKDEDQHLHFGSITRFVRTHYKGTLIGSGGYTPQTAQAALEEGVCDLVSFGRLLLANPSLVELIRDGRESQPFSPEMITQPPSGP